MSSIFNWLKLAPDGTIPLFATAITACVTIFVVVITQWILSRRARSELLTKKLEELYLVLNESSVHNVSRIEAAIPLASATPFTKENVSDSLVGIQGMDLQKKIIMYVRLYFPRLLPAYKLMYTANNEVNRIITDAESGPNLSEEKLRNTTAVYGDAIRDMEFEIVENRAMHVKEAIFSIRYKKNT